MRLDPAFQDQYVHFLATAHFVAGDYETAAAIFKHRIELNPSTDLSRSFLASALGQLGRAKEAREVWKKLMEINPDYSQAAHLERLPFKRQSDKVPFKQGLIAAGLPL